MQKKLLKSFVALCMIVLCTSLTYAVPQSNKLENKIASFRETLACQQIEQYSKTIDQFEQSAQKDTSDKETRLIICNVVLIERINAGIITKNDAKMALTNAVRDCKEYQKNHKELSYLFYVTWADLQSRLINYCSSKESITLASETEKNYKKAINLNRNFSPSYIGYGLWCYFAPSIAGGGENASLKQFNKAIKVAQKDYDKFLAYLYRSQVYFSFGKTKESLEDLARAQKVYPSSTLPKVAKEKNSQGKTFFE